MVWIILFLIIFLLINWNIPFYRDRNREKLVSDESKCFSERCRSIVYDRNRDEAVLLIHGFPATPYMYHYAAQRLDEAGFDAYAPLIPTFGADNESPRPKGRGIRAFGSPSCIDFGSSAKI